MKRIIPTLTFSALVVLLASSCQADLSTEAALTPSPLQPTMTPPPPTDVLVEDDTPTEMPIEADTPIPPPDTLIPTITETLPLPTQTAGPLNLSSPAFEVMDTIPVRHACQGEDLSPPLEWAQPPAGTQSFVLIMDDPDAVPVAGFVWDHWLLFNIPADVRNLPEGVPGDGEFPDGSRHGKNSFNRLGYGGPCPPSGQTHQYKFTLYAIDTVLDLEPGATKDQLLFAIEGHILEEAQLVGVYTSP